MDLEGGLVDDRKTGGVRKENPRGPTVGFFSVVEGGSAVVDPSSVASREPIPSGSAVFSRSVIVEAGPACSDGGSISASDSTSVFGILFLPNFALNFLRTRRCDPVLLMEVLEELVDEVLLESRRARNPGTASSSIRCCGVPW